ncbi:coiled-coil domain-containing protein, partial [Enterococcus hirae]|uniref:coiled-coil domain-containing protein n=1 Tax=Enterococcus hirae TaxID=1354 RepID=UPI002243A872
ESETQIDGKLKDTNDKITKANQDIATLNTNIDKVNNRIDQTNQQISNLGKLKKMYSNSLDFGDYDYSGRANLAPNLDFSKFSGSTTSIVPPVACFKDRGTYLELDGSEPSVANTNRNIYVPNCPPWIPGNTYVVTVPMMVSDDFNDFRTAFVCKLKDGTALKTLNPPREGIGTWQNVTGVFTVPKDLNADTTYLQLWQPKEGKGKLYIGYDIKIEKVTSTSDTATPYQPNLLDTPYYLSKVALGGNLVEKSVQFPIQSTEYLVYYKTISENYVLGQEYTVSIKATKPATQQFYVYVDGGKNKKVTLSPVEGLTDVWEGTFTVDQSDMNNGASKHLSIFQYPQATKGTVKIDWLKIEKGDTRTPNISQFKYFGEGLKDSNNPNDYSWDVTPEYTEKSLNNTVSLTEPQSVEGLKNFEDGLQIAGKEVATVPEDTGWVNLTAINGHSWNKQGQIRRIGKLVMFRGSLKGSTLSTQDFCTIPEGFRPSNPTDNYEYQFLLPPQSSNTLDNGGMAYIRTNGVCGLPSFRGTVNLFLAPIQYYID